MEQFILFIGFALLFLLSILLFVSIRQDLGKKKPNNEFLHMMIHELRAPLSAIKGASELMLVSEKPLSEDEQKKMSRLIHEQSQKLLDQVGSMLDMAKIQAKEFRIQKTPVELGKIIKESVAVFLPQAEGKHIVLKQEIEDNLPIVLVDSLRITQVINNLLSNSIKFTPPNGTIAINVIHKTTPQDQVYITVKDSGVGIPKEKQKDLFTKFYQVNQANGNLTGNTTIGTGLGLYFVKHIVESHGGNVSLFSEEGKGTTISFTLPV